MKNDTIFSSTQKKIFIKGYKFLSFAKNMSKIFSKNMSEILSSKYSLKKHLDHAIQSARDTLNTSSKRVTQTTEKATGDLIGKKTTKVSRSSPQNNSVVFSCDLSDQDNEKPWQKLKAGFNQNKYQSEPTLHTRN